MRKPVILTGRVLTPEETAQMYGLSKRHAKRLIDMVEKNLAKRNYSHLYYASSSDNKNGNLKAKTRGRTSKRTNSRTAPRRKSKRAQAAASR